MSKTLGPQFIVGEFVADISLNTLANVNETSAVEPRVMEVLHYLALRQGQVISRYELMDEIWQSNVSDGAISRVIGLLRKALGDNPDNPAYIQTVAKKGYRLVATVSDNTLRPQPEQATHRGSRSISASSILIALTISILLFTAWQFTNENQQKALLISKPRFVQLTSDPGFEYDATLSADENWLLYRHKETAEASYNLFLKSRATQQVQQLTDTDKNEFSPTFSRDQRQIAFFSKGPDYCRLKVLTLQEDGSPLEEKTLYNCGAFDHYSNVAWSVNGETLYFTDRASENVPYQIHALQIATGRTTAITQSLDNYYGDNELALSPSGKFLAFFRNKYWGNNEVHILNLETRTERKVKELGFLAWNISWTKDEKSLLFSDNRAGGELNQIDIETGTISGLYYSPQPIGSPELSSSGRSIIYSTEFADVDMWQVQFSELTAGKKPSKIPASSSRIDMQPVLSRNGEKLLFLSDRNGEMQLWLKDNTQLKVFTSLPNNVRIDNYIWHPTKPLAIISTSDKNLHLLDTAQGSSQTLDLGAAVAFPHLSADGNTLYFTSDKTGDWQLWSLDMFSLDQEQLTQRGGYRAKLNPAGDHLYFSKFRQEGIWEINLNTGKEDQILAIGDRKLDFTVCDGALIYKHRENGLQLVRHNLKTDQLTTLMSVPGNAKLEFHIPTTCDSVSYSIWDNIQSDITELILNQ